MDTYLVRHTRPKGGMEKISGESPIKRGDKMRKKLSGSKGTEVNIPSNAKK